MVQHFLVKGRVQGVGFRWFVHREAAELGLRGWVRNTVEGDVEVLVTGEPDQLKDLMKALAQGSRGSRVDKVIEHQLAESEGTALKSFEIEGAW
jgi:acylphosphatase